MAFTFSFALMSYTFVLIFPLQCSGTPQLPCYVSPSLWLVGSLFRVLGRCLEGQRLSSVCDEHTLTRQDLRPITVIKGYINKVE